MGGSEIGDRSTCHARSIRVREKRGCEDVGNSLHAATFLTAPTSKIVRNYKFAIIIIIIILVANGKHWTRYVFH